MLGNKFDLTILAKQIFHFKNVYNFSLYEENYYFWRNNHQNETVLKQIKYYII